MRNPFIAAALAAAALSSSIKAQIMSAFQCGDFVEPGRPMSYAKKIGTTVAASQRAALKTKNRAKHRRACRGQS